MAAGWWGLLALVLQWVPSRLPAPPNTLPFHLPNAASYLSEMQIWACQFFSLKAFLWLTTACRMNSKFFRMLTRPFVSVSGTNLAFQLHPSLTPPPQISASSLHPHAGALPSFNAPQGKAPHDSLLSLTTDGCTCLDHLSSPSALGQDSLPHCLCSGSAFFLHCDCYYMLWMVSIH